MKNKTIVDAVNEFKGEWPYEAESMIESKGDLVDLKKGDLTDFYRPDSDCLNLELWSFTCTKEGFNALVEEMKLGLDINAITNDMFNSYTYSAKELLRPVERCWEIDSDKLAEVFKKAEALDKKVSNTYTQEMADNGVFPSVGMEVIFKHGGYDVNGIVAAITKEFIVLTEDTGKERIRKISESPIKPMTPPITLIDGKAYQFDSITSDAVSAIYFSVDNRFYVGEEYYNTQNCTNIQPLTLD